MLYVYIVGARKHNSEFSYTADVLELITEYPAAMRGQWP